MFPSLKSLKYLNQARGDLKEWVAMGTEIGLAVGVLHLELLACQASMVSAAN